MRGLDPLTFHAYNVHAVQVVARYRWKIPKDQLLFRYYDKLGHNLDLRKSYDDVVGQRPDPKAKADLVAGLDSFFP